MVLCLLLGTLCSMGTAPRFHRRSWSVGERAEKFQRVPHKLLTMVSEGERSWETERAMHCSYLRIAPYSSP